MLLEVAFRPLLGIQIYDYIKQAQGSFCSQATLANGYQQEAMLLSCTLTPTALGQTLLDKMGRTSGM